MKSFYALLVVMLMLLVVAATQVQHAPLEKPALGRGAVKSEHITQTEPLEIRSRQLRIFTDSMLVVSDVWCGYAEFPRSISGTDPCTVWVDCPLITDADVDTVEGYIVPRNIAVFTSSVYQSLAGAPFSTNWSRRLITVGPVYGPSLSPHGRAGFYISRRNWESPDHPCLPGAFWMVVRFRNPH